MPTPTSSGMSPRTRRGCLDQSTFLRRFSGGTPMENAREGPLAPEWRRADSYEYTRHFTKREWAWEFLRRNADFAAARLKATPVASTEKTSPHTTIFKLAATRTELAPWGLLCRRSTDNECSGRHGVLGSRRRSEYPSHPGFADPIFSIWKTVLPRRHPLPDLRFADTGWKPTPSRSR